MASERILSQRSIVRVWIAFLALLLLTVGSSFLDIGPVNVVVTRLSALPPF